MKDDVVRNSGLEIKAVDYEDSTVSYYRSYIEPSCHYHI